VSASHDKGRPTPRRRPASFRTRLMGWVERVTPWFAVAVILLVAVWLAFPTWRSFDALLSSTDRQDVVWATPVMYLAALIGALLMGLVGVHAVSPSLLRLSDGSVRVLATLALVLMGLTFPLLVLRGELVPLAALVAYYLRIRRTLVDVLPPWCGGTWRPEKRRRRAGEEVIKRPPRTWDATSGVGPARAASPPTRSRRKQSKKKRRSGR